MLDEEGPIVAMMMIPLIRSNDAGGNDGGDGEKATEKTRL